MGLVRVQFVASPPPPPHLIMTDEFKRVSDSEVAKRVKDLMTNGPKARMSMAAFTQKHKADLDELAGTHTHTRARSMDNMSHRACSMR